jgi:predicted ATPase
LAFDYPGRAEITLARILWLQGYPDQAIAMARKAMADLVTIDQPVKLCRAVLWGFVIFYWNSEVQSYEEHVDRLLLEAGRHSLVTLQIIGGALKGTALLARGDTAQGLVMLKDAVERMQEHRFGPVTDCSTQFAEAMAMTGQSDEALAIIDRAIARAEHHHFMLEMPDVLRVKGEVLASRKNPDFAQAEHYFRQSLDLARRQGALGYELRTGLSLARLCQRLGHREEAHHVLHPIYARFTEGFDSRPLTEARELLAKLRLPPSGGIAIN